jgi:hypothetical protein
MVQPYRLTSIQDRRFAACERSKSDVVGAGGVRDEHEHEREHERERETRAADHGAAISPGVHPG